MVNISEKFDNNPESIHDKALKLRSTLSVYNPIQIDVMRDFIGNLNDEQTVALKQWIDVYSPKFAIAFVGVLEHLIKDGELDVNDDPKVVLTMKQAIVKEIEQELGLAA